MEVIDLSDEYVPAYCMCLEEWSDEMKESGTLKREWYDKKRTRGCGSSWPGTRRVRRSG